MTTLRAWKPFAISCLMTLAISLVTFADAEIVALGRRRSANSQQAASGVRNTVSANRDAARLSQSEQTPASQSAAAQTPVAQTPVTQVPVTQVPVVQLPDAPAPVAPAPLIARVDPLLQLAERAISRTSQRYLDAEQHTPWQIMHGMVALRRDFALLRGNQKISCVEFISDAPVFRGEHWWQVTRHGGRAHPFSVPYAFEGHANQFLALLSISNLPLTHEFNVDGDHTVTMADMVNNAKMTVNGNEEITWTLWFLTHYLDIDAEWTNENDENWSLERLVRMQTQAPVTNAPCGGCHGLFAVAYARNAFLQKHGRLRGVYFQVEQKLNQHIELARSLQNYDGSFSTEFFKGPGNSRDFNERLKASGHMLEWLMMALPQSRLEEAWIRRAVASISTDLIHNAAQPAECGPLYHSLNSLIMYRDRIKRNMTPTDEPPQLATTPDSQALSQNAQPEIPRQAMAPEMSVVPNPSIIRTPAVSPEQLIAIQPDETLSTPEAQATPVSEPDDPALSRASAPGDVLARKAAERLVRVARDNAAGGSAVAPDAKQPDLPGAAVESPQRMAVDPSDVRRLQ